LLLARFCYCTVKLLPETVNEPVSPFAGAVRPVRRMG
jgi:hypothetical protein